MAGKYTIVDGVLTLDDANQIIDIPLREISMVKTGQVMGQPGVYVYLRDGKSVSFAGEDIADHLRSALRIAFIEGRG